MLSLLTEDMAVLRKIEKANTAAGNVISDPKRGINDLLNAPQRTIIAGGNPLYRMAIAAAVLKIYGESCPIIYIHCGSPFIDKLSCSEFARQRGGIVEYTPDPLSGCFASTDVIRVVERFLSNDNGRFLSEKNVTALKFMTDALLKFGEAITLENLNEIFQKTPAMVLLALFGKNIISKDEFDMETEHMQFYIEGFDGAKETVSQMVSVFLCKTHGNPPNLRNIINSNQILSIEYSLPTQNVTSEVNTILGNAAEILRQQNRSAVLLVEDVSFGNLPFLDKLMTTYSHRLKKIIVCDNITCINGANSSDASTNAVWKASSNKIILRHDDGAETISGLFGTYKKLTVAAHIGKTKPAFGIFHNKSQGFDIIEKDTNRILPGEIRSLSDTEFFIQTGSSSQIVKTKINIPQQGRLKKW